MHKDTSFLELKIKHWPALSKLIGKNPETVIRDFHLLYYLTEYGEDFRLWQTTSWMGVACLKFPSDLITYSEIIFETKPDCIIETGVAFGGTTLYLQCMLAMTTQGRVIGIDKDLGHVHDTVRKSSEAQRGPILIESSSVGEEAISYTKSFAQGRRTMVILDSDHTYEHVLKELKTYAPLVSPGCYLVVEDTNLRLLREIAPDYLPEMDPAGAVDEFLATELGSRFCVDKHWERHLMTFNPGGYLRRMED